MNVLRVTVLTKNITRERDYKGTIYGEQSAAMYNGGDFPTPIKVPVVKGSEYAPGDYMIAPQSYVADEFGNPKLKRIQLLPLGGVEAPARK